jgi:uncharacterized coiled-coil protein SlyX/uncharacterized small protein (DUF1192 family)
MLAERGYLSLYAGEDFDGEESVTRYEMAEIIANLLENMSAGGQSLSDEDVGVIRELSLEFRDELVAVAQNQKDFEERIEKTENTNQIQNEDIADVNVRVSELQGEVTEIADNINTLAALEEEVTDIENRIADLEQGSGGQNIQDLEDAQSVNMTKINDLENRIAELESQLGANNAELRSGGDSMSTAYIIGGLALLALLL